MKKIIAGITLFLMMGALTRNADWMSFSPIPGNSQINIAEFSNTSDISHF